MPITINSKELLEVLRVTPPEQNIMLAGRHGIGKSQILTSYFEELGMKVVALFLGQMSDPGDLLGLPEKNATTGTTDFMPPYWFPVDGKPIVLFLDELNRARPEILQTVMDLALNRKLAGRKLPEGSRIISAVNEGEEYQLTDLDPALVSRFNIYTFRPTVDEWLVWAEKTGLDSRVVNFIREHPELLDHSADSNEDQGLDKDPDRRAWTKVADIMKNVTDISPVLIKVVGGVVGIHAAETFYNFLNQKSLITAEKILTDYPNVKKILKEYELHQLSVVIDSIYEFADAGELDSLDITIVKKNLTAFLNELQKDNQEAFAYFISDFTSDKYSKLQVFIAGHLTTIYNRINKFIIDQ
jgi:hypothetical protein